VIAAANKARQPKAEGVNVFDFSLGEPDFPTPANIVEAAEAACRDPKNHKYSPAGGVVQVTVTCEQVDDRRVALLQVHDDGPGIPTADLPHVFDRFYRGANVRGQQGSGLGPSIVRQVTEQPGGSVSAANAPDGGAVFTLHLPLVSADGEAHAVDASARGAEEATAGDTAAPHGAANGAPDAASAARSAAGERP